MLGYFGGVPSNAMAFIVILENMQRTAMVSRKGRRGRSERQRRHAGIAYQRRELEMASEALKLTNKDMNAEADARKPGRPFAAADASPYGNSKALMNPFFLIFPTWRLSVYLLDQGGKGRFAV